MDDPFDWIAARAACSVSNMFKQIELGVLAEEDLPELQPWAAFWYRWVSADYLKAYLEALRPSDLLPQAKAHTAVLLEAYLLTRALEESAAELSYRPEWVQIPLRGVLNLMT